MLQCKFVFVNVSMTLKNNVLSLLFLSKIDSSLIAPFCYSVVVHNVSIVVEEMRITIGKNASECEKRHDVNAWVQLAFPLIVLHWEYCISRETENLRHL